MARERALWIISQEGPDGIFSEVRAIQADSAKATYLAVLLEDVGSRFDHDRVAAAIIRWAAPLALRGRPWFIGGDPKTEEGTMETFEPGGIPVLPSSRSTGFLDVEGTDTRMPFTAVHGSEDGPRVLITGGVHGGEYPGIEAAMRIPRELDPETMCGAVVVVHPVNLPAFHARRQYVVPADGRNLNRQFPGDPEGSLSQRMAYALMEVARCMDAWVDLHGGDIHEALVPFTIYSDVAEPDVVTRSRAMAAIYGIPNVIASASVKGGTYSAAAAAGVPAILTEAGQLGRLDEDCVAIHVKGCHNVLRSLGVLPGEPEPVEPVRAFGRFEWRFAGQTGCWYPSVALGDTVEEGQPVGRVRDFFGETLQEYVAPTSGIVLFLVTSLAMNEGDPLLAVGAP